MNTYSRGLAPVINNAAPKPKLELTTEQITRMKSVVDLLLAIVGLAGVVLVSVAVPNALKAFKFLIKDKDHRPSFGERRKRTTRGFYYLKDNGYVVLRPTKNDFQIELTEKGKKRIAKLRLEILKVKKPLIWDRKFWQVAADIPVKYRKGADALRKKLKQIGFYSLQRTLWYYPYDPRKEIRMLAEEYKIDSFVTTMKIASFDPSDYKVLYEYFKETGVVEF